MHITNVNLILKISIPPEPVLTNIEQQMPGPDSSNGLSIRYESEGWGFESPSGRDIFCLKNFVTFKRTSVCVSKMNAVACTQLTFQMLTLFKNIYTTRSSIHKHGTANIWPWKLKWLDWSIRHESEGWGFESPSDIFCLENFQKNIRSCVENECCCPRTVNITNVDFI